MLQDWEQEFSKEDVEKIRNYSQFLLLLTAKEVRNTYKIDPKAQPELFENRITTTLSLSLSIALALIEKKGMSSFYQKMKNDLLKDLENLEAGKIFEIEEKEQK